MLETSPSVLVRPHTGQVNGLVVSLKNKKVKPLTQFQKVHRPATSNKGLISKIEPELASVSAPSNSPVPFTDWAFKPVR